MAPSQKDRAAWLLLAPMILIMVVVTGFPFLNTVWLAFTDASLTGRGYDWNWSGLENFAYILDDDDFRAALGHTFYFTIVSVAIEVVLGVLVALLLNQEFHGRTLVRALLILPWALPTIVNAVMWRLIYNPEFGSLNALLTQTACRPSRRTFTRRPSWTAPMPGSASGTSPCPASSARSASRWCCAPSRLSRSSTSSTS
jgi:multiple sugar transport system permease protein